MTFSVTPHAATSRAGMIAYQDDNDYIKLDWEFTGNARAARRDPRGLLVHPGPGYTTPFATVLARACRRRASVSAAATSG